MLLINSIIFCEKVLVLSTFVESLEIIKKVSIISFHAVKKGEKMDKKISFLLVLIFSFLFVVNVHAKTYQDTINEHGMWIPNEYVTKSKNGSNKYQQMTMIVRNSDGRYLYCIEPGKSINESDVFIGYDEYQTSYANMSNDKWNRINLLAYYGYGYAGHEDIKWYVITQFMIWQTNNLGYDIYFTDSLNGNRINKYENEMMEIEQLINNHNIKPDFSSELVGLLLGEDYIFVDNNNVLQNYDIVNTKNLELAINNNELHLKNNDENLENGSIVLKKESKRFKNQPIVYINETSQNLFLPGRIPDVKHELFFYTECGSLHMYKVDSELKERKQASLENALYALYDSNYNLIEQKRTLENGEINFDTKLKSGDYIFKEVEPSKGYLLDEHEYQFSVTRDNYNHYWNVFEEVIKEKYEIIKYINDKETNAIRPEVGIEFGIYDNNDNLIHIYKTSDLGSINFSLEYGNYTLKQLSVYPGYKKIKDYSFSIKENNKYNKLIFIDDPIEETKEEIDVKKVEEIIYEDKEPIIEPPTLNEEKLVVEVPNTLKNSNFNLFYILIILYIKKLL